MAGPLSLLCRLHDGVTTVGFHLAKLCLGIIVFSYSYEVIARYLFAAPTWWANEFVSYSLSIGAFLMLPHVTRAGGHVAVTLIVDSLAPPGQRAMNRILCGLGFVVCAAAAWISLDENIRQVVKDVHIMNVRPVPKIYISAWMTYGFAGSALHFLRMAIQRSDPHPGKAEARL